MQFLTFPMHTIMLFLRTYIQKKTYSYIIIGELNVNRGANVSDAGKIMLKCSRYFGFLEIDQIILNGNVLILNKHVFK